uniref:Myeloid differentiation factor 88 n=1 Tax=Hirudo medicinalis TaxID=6421 RepID=A0A0C5AZL1_HIRME|nr:myeloid differentiation factor 88 [Hirudo medicinalis]
MAEAMAQYHKLPEKLWKFCDIPFKSVHHAARAWLSLHLNPERSTFGPENGNLQDWRGVAEELGFVPIQIENFQRSHDPLSEVMKNLRITKQEAVLGDVLLAILRCERYDVLEDPQLMTQLERCKPSAPSPKFFAELQDPNVGSSNDENYWLTVGEADSGAPEYFNAFVCYSPVDLTFVKNMMTELEDKQQFKLCIPDRDFLPGPPKYEAITKLIQARCDKFIVVLSPDFLKSDECAFMLNYALALNPSARRKKLIPILYKRCEIPPILSFITLVDFTRGDVIGWFWNRLSKSLITTGCLNTISSSPSLPSLKDFQPTSQDTIVTLKTKPRPGEFLEVEKGPMSILGGSSAGEDSGKEMSESAVQPTKEEEEFIDVSTEVVSVSHISYKPFSFTQCFKSSSKK